MTDNAANIRVGIGGWNFDAWRGVFYPDGLPQKQELQFASRKLTSIEINSTFYGSQKPETFAKWHDETPDGFVFAVKGPRFATNRRVLAEASESVERFFKSGVLNLKSKLGPVNWQLAPTKQFDSEDIDKFLQLLPKSAGGIVIRHALEVRHESFRVPAFVELARKHGVAIVTAADSDYPQIADVTAPFAYLRIMGTAESEAQGYSKQELDKWAKWALQLSSGEVPQGLSAVAPTPPKSVSPHVYLYVISDHKPFNPLAAMAIIERLGAKS